MSTTGRGSSQGCVGCREVSERQTRRDLQSALAAYRLLRDSAQFFISQVYVACTLSLILQMLVDFLVHFHPVQLLVLAILGFCLCVFVDVLACLL